MIKYIFSAGTARGGTGLLTRMLSVHPKVEIALDPYLSFYKELRNSLVKEKLPLEISEKYNFDSPISSYYFSKEEINLLKEILSSNLKQKFPKNNQEKTIKTL